jgi:hypothetical protein
MRNSGMAKRRKLESKLTQEVTQIFEMLACLKIALRPERDLRPDASATLNLVRKTERSIRRLVSLVGKAAEQQLQ